MGSLREIVKSGEKKQTREGTPGCYNIERIREEDIKEIKNSSVK